MMVSKHAKRPYDGFDRGKGSMRQNAADSPDTFAVVILSSVWKCELRTLSKPEAKP